MLGAEFLESDRGGLLVEEPAALPAVLAEQDRPVRVPSIRVRARIDAIRAVCCAGMLTAG